MAEIIEIPKVTSDIAKESSEVAERALVSSRAIMITNDPQYVTVGETLKTDKKYLSFIEGERKKAVDPLNGVIKTINGWFRPARENLEKAISIKSGAMQVYDNKKAEIARIAQAKLQDEANKKAATLEERARKAAEKGNEERAEELRQQALQKAVIVPTVNVEKVKIQGLTTRTNWSYEITDVNLIPREFMCPNDKLLGQLARSTKGTLSITGIKWIETEEIVGSR